MNGRSMLNYFLCSMNFTYKRLGIGLYHLQGLAVKL